MCNIIRFVCYQQIYSYHISTCVEIPSGPTHSLLISSHTHVDPGKRLARAAEGLGMHVQGVTSRSSRHALETLFATSDVVSLHCPVTDATIDLVDHRMLLQVIKPGALLLNLARAQVLNKEALLQALDEQPGRLGGVGLDVHWHEPADPLDPLYAHPKVLALPHAGVASVEVYEAYAELLVGNIISCREGGALRGVLNQVVASTHTHSTASQVS